MTERDIIVAFGWIIGIGVTALASILWALAMWVVKHIESLRATVSEEMRSFDVRIAKLETIARMRREDQQDRRNAQGGAADD